MKRVFLMLVVFAGLVILGGIGLLWLSGYGGRFGGLSWDYPAKDFDPELTKQARAARPVIAAADAFIERNRRIPSAAELSLSRSQTVSYEPEKDDFIVYVKLGWDPSLIYTSKDRKWWFEPGDGSEGKYILLSP